MIKLKDLLNESTSIEMHKIITAKDNPSFMTEEQWQEKWETNSLLKEINEAKSPAEIKKIVQKVHKKIPFLQKWVAKAIKSNLKNDPKVRNIMKKFLETGNITRRDAMNVWPRIIQYTGNFFGTGVVASTFALMGLTAIYALPLTILLVWAFFQFDPAGVMKNFVPGGITPEEKKKWKKILDKRYNSAKRKGKDAMKAVGLTMGQF